MRLYEELAPWWPLLSRAEDYREEADLFWRVLSEVLGRAPASLLELGSGGGHVACHLPPGLDLWLLDRSEAMLANSRRRNPGRVHVQADLRTAALGRDFDAVLLHDACMYLVEDEDLRAACRVAAAHLRPGGLFLLLPDLVEEGFEPGTTLGGGDGEDGRAARLMEWVSDPLPGDGRYRVDMALLLREADGRVRAVHEAHELALRARAGWWAAIRSAGLRPVEAPPRLAAAFGGELFLARRDPGDTKP